MNADTVAALNHLFSQNDVSALQKITQPDGEKKRRRPLLLGEVIFQNKKCVCRKVFSMGDANVTSKFKIAKIASFKQLNREYDIMNTLDHVNICKAESFFVHRKIFYLITNYAGRTLSHILGPSTPRQVTYDALRQIINALIHMHAAGIVHLDLKPSNIVAMPSIDTMTRDGFPLLKVTVIDFGSSRRIGTIINHTVGTKGYMPLDIEDLRSTNDTIPVTSTSLSEASVSVEVPEEVIVDTCHDIWTLGRVICGMFTGKKGLPTSVMYDTDENVDKINKQEKWIQAAQWCLEINPTKRPSAKQLLEFLQNE